MKPIFVTGNAEKFRYFSELVGHKLEHQKVDVVEVQSLVSSEVVHAKVKTAYEIFKRPVIIEDTSLIIHSMGLLPGTFIKWFMEQMGVEGICRLTNVSQDRRATAAATFAYYDGSTMRLFEGSLTGTIATEPRGSSGFGWNAIFIPNGSTKTLGEMDEDEFKSYYIQIKPFPAVKQFLDNL